MPVFAWPVDLGIETKDFEQRHSNPDAGKLLRVAASCVDELHYLDEIDLAFDRTGKVPGSHHRGVVDFAHARWATSTCITAVDLCAAGLARAVGGHTGTNDLDVNYFRGQNKPGVQARLGQMPALARDWINAVIADRQYDKLSAARHALTHQWLPAEFTLGIAQPPKRLGLTVLETKIPLRRLVVEAREFATGHVPSLIKQLRRI